MACGQIDAKLFQKPMMTDVFKNIINAYGNFNIRVDNISIEANIDLL